MKKLFNAISKKIKSSETFVLEEGKRKATLTKSRFLFAQSISGQYSTNGLVVESFTNSSLGSFPKAFEEEKEKAKVFCRTGQSPK